MLKKFTILALLLLSGCSASGENLTAIKKETYQQFDQRQTIEGPVKSTVDYDFIEPLDNLKELETAYQNQAIYLYLGFQDCPYCKALVPKLDTIGEWVGQPTIYYIDIKKWTRLNPEDYEKLQARYPFEQVPQVFHLQKKSGKIQSQIDATATAQEIEDFLDPKP